MAQPVIPALVFFQNWGENREILSLVKNNSHISSIFHIMGNHSYLLDTNFDTMEQLASWINTMKSITLPSGVPALLSMQTQRIIEVKKKKSDFSLQDYLGLSGHHHLFVEIDNPHHDEPLLEVLQGNPLVHSVLHIQGESSYVAEVIVQDYNDYRTLLSSIKRLETIHHIETHEVISVVKYRNRVMSEGGELVSSKEDIRELFSL
jgi:hypothetical protein